MALRKEIWIAAAGTVLLLSLFFGPSPAPLACRVALHPALGSCAGSTSPTEVVVRR